MSAVNGNAIDQQGVVGKWRVHPDLDDDAAGMVDRQVANSPHVIGAGVRSGRCGKEGHQMIVGLGDDDAFRRGRTGGLIGDDVHQ